MVGLQSRVGHEDSLVLADGQYRVDRLIEEEVGHLDIGSNEELLAAKLFDKRGQSVKCLLDNGGPIISLHGHHLVAEREVPDHALKLDIPRPHADVVPAEELWAPLITDVGRDGGRLRKLEISINDIGQIGEFDA